MNNDLLVDSLWPAACAVQVEQICNRFEAACKAGGRPSIDAYLGDTPTPERSILLGELVALELEYRAKLGEEPDPQDYEHRFPEHVELIHEVFRDSTPVPRLPGADRADSDTGEPSSPSGQTELTCPYDPNSAGRSGEQALPRVPGYEILGVLGRGGMGIVYQARDRQLNRLVALKMILASADAGERARFRSEASAVARLQHPHIVQIYEIGEQAGLPYFSLEFVDGGTLKAKLAGAPLPAGQSARLIEVLARALHFAHQRGIVHRDLKPANVLLAQSDSAHGIDLSNADGSSHYEPKITDFGLAKRLDEDSGQTRSGAIMGTPSYMAPEQAAGKHREIGPAADVYALGAVLYEMLTGRPPFRAPTLLETLEQVCSQDPLPPTRLQPKVPRDLETICLKCLEKEPRKRYVSAEALADDLRRFLASEPIQARRTPLWERGWKWVKRRPATAALIGVIALASIGLFAGIVNYKDQQRVKAEQRLAEREAESKVADLKREAQQANTDKRWPDAKEALASAFAFTDSHPSLQPLREALERVQEETERGAAAELASRDFFKWYEQALIQGTMFTGVDLPTNLAATREAIEKAFELLGVSVEHMKGPVFDDGFTKQQRNELVRGCYELLLVLAETRVRQNPPQVQDALVILDRAWQLGLRTKAYHLRRTRYLEMKGDQAGKAREEGEAKRCPLAEAFDHFLVGEDLWSRGQLEPAIAEFEAALRLQPSHFWARYYLATCYLSLPRPKALPARDCLTACLVKEPTLAPLYLLRGFAHALLSQFSAAEGDFQAALDRKPSVEVRWAVLVNRGIVHKRQRKFDAAEADLKQAVQLMPNAYQAPMNLAEAYQEQGLRDQIVGIETGALLPGHGQGVMNVLSACQHQKKLREAVEQLDKATVISQPKVQAKELESSSLARLYHFRGELHRRQRDLSAALADFDRAIKAEPPGSKSLIRAEAHAERGRILYVTKEYSKAVAAFNAALQTYPDKADVYRWRAEALAKLERFDEAARSSDEYLKRGGKPSAGFYALRGQLRAQLHEYPDKYPDVIADYTLALAMKPDSITHAALGWVYVVTDAKALALHNFQEAIRLDAKNGDAYNGRGFIRARLGEYSAAQSDVREAVRLGPQTARHMWNAARVYAEIVFRSDIDRNSRNGRALPTRVDNQAQAIELLRQALERTPAPERAAFWQSKIEGDPLFGPIRSSAAYGELKAKYSGPAPVRKDRQPKPKVPVTKT